jgi:hypothetical protein
VSTNGVVGLGRLGYPSLDTIQHGVSTDGSVVVGFAPASSGESAYVWDRIHKMRDLREVLTGQGVDLTGWSLVFASGVSADGRTIVGWGINPNQKGEGWIARLDPFSVPNHLPVASPDERIVSAATPVPIKVLANDSDPDSDPLTIIITANPAHGTAVIDDNATPSDPSDDFVVYTAQPGFNGTDRFTYQISDGRGGTATATVNLASRHAFLEFLSKGFVYTNHVRGDNAGYGYTVDTVLTGTISGFYALGLKSPDAAPILVFRGTELTLNRFLPDLFADFDSNGVGYRQFEPNRGKVGDWVRMISTSGPVTITGHSLGGALTQWFAADLTSQAQRLGEVVTFNSPGIGRSFADLFRVDLTLGATHYVVNGDIVSMAGEAFLKGRYVLESFLEFNPLNKHGLPVLAESIGARHRPADIEAKLYSSVDWLNSPFFIFTDPVYYVYLGLAQEAMIRLGQFQTIPSALLFRSSTEGVRREIGAAWERFVASVFPFSELRRAEVTLPNISLGLPGAFKVNVSGLKLGYIPGEGAKVQGTVTIPTLYNATADFSGSNYITITDERLEAVGTLYMGGFTVGSWGLESASLSFNTAANTVEGRAAVRIPGGVTVEGGLGFAGGQFNSISLAVRNLDAPIPFAPGLFLQDIGGKIDHIAVNQSDPNLISFTGTVRLTVGPEVQLTIPLSWAGTFTGSVASITLQATLDARHLEGDALFVFGGGILRGDGHAVLNWSEGVLRANAQLAVLGGLTTLDSQFAVDSTGKLTLSGVAAGRLPTIRFTFLQGQQIGSMRSYFQYRPQRPNDPTDDFVTISGTLLGFLSLGVKVDFAGTVTFIDDEPATVASVQVNGGSAQRSMVNGLTVTFSTPVSLGQPPSLLRADGRGDFFRASPSSAVSAFRLRVRRANNTWNDVSSLLRVRVALTADGRTRATLTFAGPGVVGGSLADGRYELTILADRVRDVVHGAKLDGDKSGFAGGNRVGLFSRLFGDGDGDGDVDAADLAALRAAYGSRSKEARYRWYFNADGDRDIDALDFHQFKRRSLPWLRVWVWGRRISSF